MISIPWRKTIALVCISSLPVILAACGGGGDDHGGNGGSPGGGNNGDQVTGDPTNPDEVVAARTVPTVPVQTQRNYLQDSSGDPVEKYNSAIENFNAIGNAIYGNK